MPAVGQETTRHWANGRPIVRVVLEHDPLFCASCRAKKAYRERLQERLYKEAQT